MNQSAAITIYKLTAYIPIVYSEYSVIMLDSQYFLTFLFILYKPVSYHWHLSFHWNQRWRFKSQINTFWQFSKVVWHWKWWNFSKKTVSNVYQCINEKFISLHTSEKTSNRTFWRLSNRDKRSRQSSSNPSAILNHVAIMFTADI